MDSGSPGADAGRVAAAVGKLTPAVLQPRSTVRAYRLRRDGYLDRRRIASRAPSGAPLRTSSRNHNANALVHHPAAELDTDERRQVTIPPKVQYESKENGATKFWTARYGRYAIRVDATRPGVCPWLITLEGRTVHKGVAPNRDEAAAGVSDALDELPRWKS